MRLCRQGCCNLVALNRDQRHGPLHRLASTLLARGAHVRDVGVRGIFRNSLMWRVARVFCAVVAACWGASVAKDFTTLMMATKMITAHMIAGSLSLTRACSRRSRQSRRLLAQAPRQPSSLLKLVVRLLTASATGLAEPATIAGVVPIRSKRDGR